MRHVSLLLIFFLGVCISGVAWAASCERCYEKVADGNNLCTECKLSTSSRLTDMKSSTDEADRYIAQTRLKELKEKGY